MNEFKCPVCNKTIIENNLKNNKSENDLIIKSRLIFLNSDGEVLCRCLECKSMVGLPLEFIKKSTNN